MLRFLTLIDTAACVKKSGPSLCPSAKPPGFDSSPFFASSGVSASSKNCAEFTPVMFGAILLLERRNSAAERACHFLNTAKPNPLPSSIAREDEHLLVAAAKRGDNSAFEELVNRYERKIFRLTMNITGNREDAQDATQEAFLKAYTHLAGFHGDSRFYTWLVRIAANEALMRLRRRRPGEFSLDESMEGEESDILPRAIEDWRPSPEQDYAQLEMQTILNGVIEKLHPKLRVVFVLRDMEELSTQETADTLGISVAAVKARLLRARLQLREKLNRYLRKGAPN
jgi:RNA polymerase sigma-70 factor (ECF subfamily)